MVSDTGCLEIIAKRINSPLRRILRPFTVVLTACFLLLGLFSHWAFLVAGILMGILAYFVWLESRVEYEYVYVDRELRVSKIQQLSRRKELGRYDLTKMEILAPERSHVLDSFRQNKAQVLDYSSGDPQAEDLYDLWLTDGRMLRLNLGGSYGEEFLQIMRQFYPRKVYVER